MNKKHKEVCRTLNYIEHLLILASAATRCISISAFASLLRVTIRITSSEIVLTIYKIPGLIKEYKSINENKKRREA